MYTGFVGIIALLMIAYSLSNNRKGIKISNDILGIGIASIFRNYNSQSPYCKVAVFIC